MTAKLLPSTPVAARYQVTRRTLERWLRDEKLNFPMPIVVNSRRYWREEDLELWERSRARYQAPMAA